MVKKFEIFKSDWEVKDKFDNLKIIGAGCFGTVCVADDITQNNTVAIKKLWRPFINVYHAKRAFCELWLLKNIHHENLINLIDAFTNDDKEYSDVYIVMPYMGFDLSNLLRIQNLSSDHIQFLTYQIFRGLKYLHSGEIIHRDLKPSNIVVNENCELKILDFGLARAEEHKEDAIMTGYVATRWYRAPELLFNWTKYGKPVDMWSAGCIIFELLSKKVLFQGNGPIDQLLKIIERRGMPPPQFLDEIQNKQAKEFFNSRDVQDTTYIDSRLKDYLPKDVDTSVLDLLDLILRWDPETRINSVQALAHPYLETYSDPEDEPICNRNLAHELSQGLYLGEKCPDQLGIDDWKRKIYEEIQSFPMDIDDTIVE